MDKATESLVTIAGGIIGLATLAIIVSNKSNASGIIQNIASGFGNVLGVAVSPVTGTTQQINTSYAASPSGGGLGNLTLPSLGSFALN